MMSGRPPVRPTGSWGTPGVKTATSIGPGAAVLRTAIRVVPLSSAPPGPLGPAVVPVSLGSRASGWNGGVVVFVLFASGSAPSSLGRTPPCGSFSDQFQSGPVLGSVLTITAT
jgi:hypothetical protein